MKKGKLNLKYDKFIESVRPNPKSTPTLKIIEGYIGKSSVAKHCRLYFDHELNNFIEIPEDAIQHAIALEDSTFGGSRLWVLADSVCIGGDPSSEQRPKANLLQGNLFSRFKQHIPQQPDLGPDITNKFCPTGNANCPPTTFGNECPSEYLTACLSSRIKCDPFTAYARTECVCPVPTLNRFECNNITRPITRCICTPLTSPEYCQILPTISGFACKQSNSQIEGYGFNKFNPFM